MIFTVILKIEGRYYRTKNINVKGNDIRTSVIVIDMGRLDRYNFVTNFRSYQMKQDSVATKILGIASQIAEQADAYVQELLANDPSHPSVRSRRGVINDMTALAYDAESRTLAMSAIDNFVTAVSAIDGELATGFEHHEAEVARQDLLVVLIAGLLSETQMQEMNEAMRLVDSHADAVAAIDRAPDQREASRHAMSMRRALTFKIVSLMA
jgi:hypothetical protein